MGEQNQERPENADQKYFSLQNKIRILIVSALLFSAISILIGIYTIFFGGLFNPDAFWAFGGVLPLAILVIFLLWKYWKKNGYNDEIKNLFVQFSSLEQNLDQNFQQKHIDFEEQKAQEIKKLEKNRRELEEENQKIALILKKTQFYYRILTFFREFNLGLNDSEIYNLIINDLKDDSTPSDLFKLLEEKGKFNKEILEILYQYNSHIPLDKDLWTKIKQNFLELLETVLEHAEKLVGFARNLPHDVLLYLLKNLNSFSIEAFNRQITFIDRFSAEIQDFYLFTEEENINASKYSLWKDILDWQSKFIGNPPNFEQQFWDLCKNAIKFDSNWKLKENLEDVFVFYFFRERYPQQNIQFCKFISQSIETAKILYFFLQNKRTKRLGDFFSENIAQIRIWVDSKETDPLFEAFHSELIRGRFISEENRLFKIYRDERSFDLSYLTHLILNPDMPIDFDYAQDHYFSIETSVTGLLRNMSLGKKRPFLLTFDSDGGIADAINELMNPVYFTEFKEKYDIRKYSDSARLGILNDKIDNLERYEAEMNKDLPKTFPFMKKILKKKFRGIFLILVLLYYCSVSFPREAGQSARAILQNWPLSLLCFY